MATLSEEYSLNTIKAVGIILGKENILAGVYIGGFFGAKEEEKTGHVFIKLKKTLTESGLLIASEKDVAQANEI